MHLSRLSLVSLIFLILGALLIPGNGAVSAQDSERCFPETGHCISGPIRQFWERNGGLLVFGFPLGPQQEEFIEGKRIQAQWFERNRIELHPENQPPYNVLLGRLSEDRLGMDQRDWRSFPASSPQPGCRFFPETNHNVCGRILEAWRANGLELDGIPGFSEAENLALFGLPLSDAQTETLEDGRQYTVQWFERARFELHPENARPFDVLLGLLGSALYPRQPPSYVPPPPEQPGGAPPPPPFPAGPRMDAYDGAAPAPIPAQAALKIMNNTGQPVRVSLAGPTATAWSVVRDVFDAVIAPGGYQAIVTAWCGTSTTNFSVGAGKTVELSITCAQEDTAEVRLVNQTGGTARLALTGPTALNLVVGSGGRQTGRVRPGDYRGTATAPCGSVAVSFSLAANEVRELTLQCPGRTSTVSIANTSNEPIRVNLVGPTSESFTVPGGQTVSRQVMPGEYEVTVDSACGRESRRFAIADGETYTLTYTCVRQTAVIEVTNKTGGVLTITLDGPTRGRYDVPNGQSRSIEVLPGSYSITVSARCGSETVSVTVENGEVHNLGTYYCSS
ncbi:MAG: hypothetical protein N2378_05315 [Chloroflexaceae bacterium]|nr:hypothetical protein [Chloroflexaceae bacterium]